MKYWLLTSEFPPFYGGGISTYCNFTAEMLASKGHEVSVFVNDPSVKDIKEEQSSSGRIIRFNPSRTNSSSFLGHVTNLSYEFAQIVKHFIEKEGQPDIIEAQEYLGIGYYLQQFKLLGYDWCKEIPVLITMHSPSFLYLEYNQVPLFKYPNFWIGEMERFSIRAADVLVSPSRFLIEEVNKRFPIENENISVLPNPFQFTLENTALEKSDQSGEIVFFGKLSAQKGTFKLLQYFKNLWDDGFKEALHLIGGQDIVYHPEGKTMGDLVRNKYKNFISKGLLVLEDKIAPSEIKKRLQRAKVVIIPSTIDNLPYVVMEMMSQGLIVLISKQGGQAEIVEDAKDGFIFNHDEPETFYAQLKKILALSDSARKLIGQNAIEKIRKSYALNIIYDQKIELVQKAILQQQARNKFPFLRLTEQEKELPVLAGSKPALLSVIVPYYNMGKYLDETIASIKKSEYPNIEILIINDGSTDEGSIAKLETYRNKLEIKIIDTPNQGLAGARNMGAEKANGTLIAFLDADDLVEPTYFSKAIKVLEKYSNVHFVGAWTQYFEGSEKIWPTFTPEPPLILFHNLINSSALVYKREAFLTAGQNDPKMPFQGLEDYDSVISLLSNGFKGVTLPEPLFRYRVRKDSMIRQISKIKKTVLQDYITQKHQQYYANFASQTFNLLTANGPGLILDNPSLDYDFTGKLPFKGQLSRQLIGIIKKNKFTRFLAYRAYHLINN